MDAFDEREPDPNSPREPRDESPRTSPPAAKPGAGEGPPTTNPDQASAAPEGAGAVDLELPHRVAATIAARLREAIVGRDDVVEKVLVALFAGGHVLLEDFPGSGKTMLARALGDAIEAEPDDRLASFRRVQFTPDLLPSDITGVSVFEPERGSFTFMPGPVFSHVLLADEINRTSPKVQSALLEAMAEAQVTVDNVTYRLDELFVVIATQNPLGMAGTFPLPAPQLDRFLFKIRMRPIARDAELEVVTTYRKRLHPPESERPRAHREEVLAARARIEAGVRVAPAFFEALVDVANAVRADARVALGISTRALVQAVPALQARALLRGRGYVSSEDLDELLEPLFAHRIVLAPGVSEAEAIVRECATPVLEALARGTLRRS